MTSEPVRDADYEREWEAGRNRFMDALSPGAGPLRTAAAEVVASWEGLSMFTIAETIEALRLALIGGNHVHDPITCDHHARCVYAEHFDGVDHGS